MIISSTVYFVIFLLLTIFLLYRGVPLWLWTIYIAGVSIDLQSFYVASHGGSKAQLGDWFRVAMDPSFYTQNLGYWICFILLALLFNVPILRRNLISRPLVSALNALKILPSISDTEREALEAGVVWVESEFFSGKPSLKNLFSQPKPKLTVEEEEFIKGPLEEFCGKIPQWQAKQEYGLSDELMEEMKKLKLFGMIIPKKYGGLGFSPYAHALVIEKLGTVSSEACITAMVPNSLGPAELLYHFGTSSQKDKLLHRLATGDEIPCFGLTEPTAGSDAGSITSEAVLFKGEDGDIYARLNWNKRWITLAAISTTIGLAVKLKDPEHLLGDKEDLGITCFLVPSSTPGVKIGRRHSPLYVHFYNCPTQGENVVVKASESIIGGLDYAGKGWSMLMSCLGMGRGISLPSSSLGSIKNICCTVSAHSVVRRQFGLSIGKFEGVMEPLGRVASTAYFIDAMRDYTLSALNQGIAPPVITAISKYQATEANRRVANDAMDVMGGAGISLGPRNLLLDSYLTAPISITVEGANILTRTLMIFGQGALRAHPYAFLEVSYIENQNIKGFDKAFFAHLGFILRNITRSVVLSLTHGLFTRTSGSPKGLKRYAQKLKWASASFAAMTDIAMGTLGGDLKRKEKLTGRFADILSWMYIATAVMSKYKWQGCRKEDYQIVRYSLDHAFFEIQKAFDGLFENFSENPIMKIFFKFLSLHSRFHSLGQPPSDELGSQVVSSFLATKKSKLKDNLTSLVYKNHQVRLLEAASFEVQAQGPVLKKVRNCVRKGKIKLGFKEQNEVESILKSKLPEKLRELKIFEVFPSSGLVPGLPVKGKSPKVCAVDESVTSFWARELSRNPSTCASVLAGEKGLVSSEEYQGLLRLELLSWLAIQVDDFTDDEYKHLA